MRDIPSEETLFNKARANEINLKNMFKGLVKTYSIDSNTAKILTALFYWCEGSKYPASNCLGFTNSDPALVKTFLELLRKGFVIEESRLKASLQIHSTHEYNDVLKFWSDLLKINKDKFYRPTITQPRHNMKRQNYVGTCTIKYHDVKLLLSIIGLYESFAVTVGEVAEWTKAEGC